MAIRGLEQRVQLWKDQGFISAEQAKKIVTFENTNPGRSWIAYGVAAIGLVAIATGFISIIAANWESISESTKLVIYFTLQVGLGLGFLKFANKQGLPREIFLSLFALLALGGIGLVGQIFHLESDGWQGLRFWLILILPISLLAQSRFLPNIWFAGLFTTLGIWFGSAERSYIADYAVREAAEVARVMMPLSFVYGVIAIGALSSKFAPLSFINAARTWGWLLLLGGVVTLTNVTWSMRNVSGPIFSFSVGLVPFIVSLIAAGLYFLRSKIPEERKGALVLMILAPLSCFLFILPLTMKREGFDLLGIAFFLLEFSLAAAAAALLNRKRLFDLATFVIAIRFIVAYFEVFGTLAATGIGLIISGVVILGAVWGWYKLRSHFALLLTRKA